MTEEEFQILDHTMYRAARALYCGSGSIMTKLINDGYMRFVLTPSWTIDSYFTITEEGIKAHDKYQREMVTA